MGDPMSTATLWYLYLHLCIHWIWTVLHKDSRAILVCSCLGKGEKKGSLLAMWLSPVPLALVGCTLELALQPEDVGEEAAGRGLGAFTGLAP